MNLRYLLWDHDGVLVDTEHWYFEATRRTLARVGAELTQPRFLELSTIGNGYWDPAREQGATEEEILILREERDALYRSFVQREPLEIEGVTEVLGDLSRDYRMAIVTTARRADFELIHAERDIARHFEFVLTLEDYARSKPRPDPYLAGLARFGAAPDETIVLEDSTRGLRAALAAGLRCIIIRNAFTATDDFDGALRVVDSIREVPALLAALQPGNATGPGAVGEPG